MIDVSGPFRVFADGGEDSERSRASVPVSRTEDWGWDSDGVIWVDDSVAHETLLQAIVDLSGDGRVPTREDVLTHTAFHPAVFVRRFGSFTAALEQAQVLPGRRDTVLDSAVLDEIHALADDVGRPLVPTELPDEFVVGIEEVFRRFGRWNNALSEAGVEIVSGSELSDEDRFLLYQWDQGSYRRGFGANGFLSGWGEQQAVVEFLDGVGESRFTAEEFAAGVKCSVERAEAMLEFADSLGVVRRDDAGWVVRVDDQEEVAGWLSKGKGQE